MAVQTRRLDRLIELALAMDEKLDRALALEARVAALSARHERHGPGCEELHRLHRLPDDVHAARRVVHACGWAAHAQGWAHNDPADPPAEHVVELGDLLR